MMIIHLYDRSKFSRGSLVNEKPCAFEQAVDHIPVNPIDTQLGFPLQYARPSPRQCVPSTIIYICKPDRSVSIVLRGGAWPSARERDEWHRVRDPELP